ncbi:MAG: hypothetical protein HOQ07_07270, partial [Sinomonas sp.]|nr:hypothetical protein [Sinomonas sp.]
MSNDQIQSGEQRAPWPPAGTRVYVSEPGGARPNGQYPPRPFGQMAARRSPAWAAAAPVGLSPQDADRSRKWRTLIGVSSLILGAFAAFYAGLSVIALDRAGRGLAVALAVTVGIYGLGAAA